MERWIRNPESVSEDEQAELEEQLARSPERREVVLFWERYYRAVWQIEKELDSEAGEEGQAEAGD